MSLEYLLFDYSEGDDDTGLFDALAEVPLARATAVQAEVDTVLKWAEQHFGHTRGPVEEGGDWAADLQVQDEEGGAWRSFRLSLVGSPAFCEAFRDRFNSAVN